MIDIQRLKEGAPEKGFGLNWNAIGFNQLEGWLEPDLDSTVGLTRIRIKG